MKNAYIDIFKTLDKSKLMTRDEVLEYLRENGAHEPTLAALSSQYKDVFGIDPIWHYHLSDGWNTGAFIVPVQEGYMWIPYDEVDPVYYEILLVDETSMLDKECCDLHVNDLREYANDMCDVLEMIRDEKKEGE